MNNAPRFQSGQARHTRAGFSLVEVLVVLVVLVVGILAIVRLFPAGFIALRNAQNSTFADRLGQAALESLKQGQGTLPDAVYMYVDSANGGFNPNVAPDDLYSYSPDPTTFRNQSHDYGLLNAAAADINKQRYISNETVAVPAAHVTNNVMYPPLYPVAFGPIYLPTTAVPAGGAALPYLKVNSAPWTDHKGDSRVDPSDPNAAANPSIARHFTNPADTLSPTQGAYLADLANGTAATLRPTQTAYLVDKDAGQIAVPTASYDQTFTLTITQKYKGTTTQALTVPALGFDTANNAANGYVGGWFSTIDTVAGDTALPSTTTDVGGVSTPDPWLTVTLTRPFQYMGVLPALSGPMVMPLPFTNDPYQYCLDSGNIAGGPATENMGVLAFNPVSGGKNGLTAGIPALQAQVSYETLNWHVLHENLDVPTGGGTLKLVLDHLKRVGDVQFDGTTFAGLTSDTNTPAASQYDLLLLDRDTGDTYAFRGTGGNTTAVEYADGATAGTTPTGTTLSVVDNGDDPNATTTPIVLNYAGGRVTLPASFAGKHLRVFYSGDADWAVALQKAPSTYTLAAAAADLSMVNTNLPNRFYYASSGSAHVYFPACDAGKTVELDGISCAVTDKNNMPQTRIASQTTQPISETSDGTGYFVDLGPNGAGVLQTGDVIIVSADPTKPSLKVAAARGVSLRAVVIWHEHNNWHTRATDTLLTRSQP